MTRKLITGNGAAAWAARLAGVDYVPAFPITPQTEIIETIASWTDGKEMDATMVTMESEHSMITAAGAAAATGVRVFTATSSQGLLYAMEMLYTVAGWRVPFVLVNVSRALASPVTLEPDHNDVLAARDSGFLQLHCSTCQEVLDGVLLAYRLAEDRRVRLPVIVNLDGFYLSFTREPVEIPDAETVRRFLPPFAPGGTGFRASAPVSQAVAVLGGGPYSYFRYETHLAISTGKGGVLFAEIASALYCLREAAPVMVSFIGGLGGRDISSEEFFEMARVTKQAAEEGKAPPPRLLYTAGELKEVRKLQTIAHVERGRLEEEDG
jgi:pyruvate ferredoxin oxidoreductase alpha subunit